MRFRPFLCALLLLPALARADAPPGAEPLALDVALSCVSERYLGEALKVEAEDDGRLAQIRWLTPAGNVLKIELTGPGCRFLEVEGTGQTEARRK